MTVQLEPAAVMPVQLVSGLHSVGGVQPERRLMLAVLEDAVLTYQRFAFATTRPAAREFREAQSWMKSDDVHWPVSFLNVCDQLGLDAGALRSGLRLWRERERQRPACERVRLPQLFRRTSGVRTHVRGKAPGGRAVG